MPQEHERFKLIADAEDRCAIWPADQPTPPTWRDIGVAGTGAVLSDFLEQVHASAARMRRLFEQDTRIP